MGSWDQQCRIVAEAHVIVFALLYIFRVSDISRLLKNLSNASKQAIKTEQGDLCLQEIVLRIANIYVIDYNLGGGGMAN